MSNIIVSGRNWLDEDGVVLSGGNWLASLPLTNLQNAQPRVVARAASGDLADTVIDVDLGVPRPVGLIALVWHTGTVGSRVRVRGGSDSSFASVDLDTGWLPLWPQDHDFGDRAWGRFTWGERIAPDVYPNLNRARYIVPLEETLAQYWRIEVDCFGDAFDLGRLVLAEVLRPKVNLTYGWQVTVLDPSRSDVSLGGQTYTDVVQRKRRLDFALPALTSAEAWGVAADIDLVKGLGGDVVVIPIPPTRQAVTAISVSAGGSGYTAGDIVSVAGGAGTAARLEVVAVDGSGAVTSAALYEGGDYATPPSSPVAVTGGTGAGAAFTATFAWRDPAELHKQAVYGAWQPAAIANPFHGRFAKSYTVEEMI